MMNKVRKFLVILLMGMIVFSSFSIVMASSEWGENIIGEGDKIGEEEEPEAADKINTYMGNAAVVVKIIAVATAVIILIVLGMKYMIAAPGDKADIKKSMIPYVIGAFVVFAAAQIVEILIKFSSQIKG